MLRDDGGQYRKFGDLVPGRFGVVRAGLLGQRCLAPGANLRDMRHGDVHPSRGQPDSVMAFMPGLPTAAASGGRFDNGLGSVEWIGRRRRRAIGRVALDLSEKLFVLSFKCSDTSRCSVEFTTHASAFRAVRAWSRSLKCHKPRGYDFRTSWQELAN
jgi:hypothetical protein